jgi:hypothetical protein
VLLTPPIIIIIADITKISPQPTLALTMNKCFLVDFLKCAVFEIEERRFSTTWALQATFDQNIKSLIFSGVKIFLVIFLYNPV